MLLEEARRRNRRRISALAVVAVLNHWVVVTIVATGVIFWAAAKADEDRAEYAFGALVVIGIVVAFLIVVTFVLVKVRGAARATVKALGAELADGGTHKRLKNLAEELALAVGIEPVAIAILDDPVPNALTVGTGRRSTIVVTSGLIEQLARDELEAVLAVQMCAIRRLDVALQTVVVASASGAASIHRGFRDDWKDPRVWIWIAVTWPSWLLAQWIRRSAYAQCDMGADDMAITITRHPEALRRALAKLLDDPGVVAAVTSGNAPLWFEPVPEPAPQHSEARIVQLERHSMTPSLEARIARLDAA